MKNPKQLNYWILGGFENAKPMTQALEEARSMGLDGVELCFGAGGFNVGTTEAECKAIRKSAEGLGMAVHTVAAGSYWGCSLSDPSAAVRRKAVEFTKQYLQAANWVGAEVALVVPGAVAVPWDPNVKHVPYQTAWKNATASLRELLPVAKKHRVKIGLENVWNWFLSDAMAMRTFIDQFKSPWIGSYFDVGNCLINGYAQDWVEILDKRIVAVHVKNFSRSDCGGVLRGFGDDLAKGDLDVKAVTAALKRIKYSGPLTAEMIPFCRLPNLVMPDMALARDTAEKLQKMFG